MIRPVGMILSGLMLAACGGGQEAGAGDSAVPLSPDQSRAAGLALVCSGCHGADNLRLIDLSDLPAATLEERFLAYKSDETGGTAMHRIARGYSEEEIALIAAYLGQAEGASR